jgi:leucyl/phenylalanyl-tRNA---protein transferase
MTDRNESPARDVPGPLLEPHVLLRAYASGFFPMADPSGEICWFCPDPRTVIFPDLATRRRLDRHPECTHVIDPLRNRKGPFWRDGLFTIRVDTAFERVMDGCRQRPEGSWINQDILDAYCGLRDLGFAHSVEAWQGGQLVGGLYGVAIGALFVGESMFHSVTGASKATLIWLIERCRQAGYQLLDVQWLTPHLKMYGAVEIPRSRYLRRLSTALASPACFLRRQEVLPDWVTWYRQPDEAAQERQWASSPMPRICLDPDGGQPPTSR